MRFGYFPLNVLLACITYPAYSRDVTGTFICRKDAWGDTRLHGLAFRAYYHRLSVSKNRAVSSLNTDSLHFSARFG